MKKKIEQKSDSKKSSYRKYIIAAGLLLIFIIAFLYFVYSNQMQPEPDSLSETLILKEAGWVLGKEPNNMTVDDFGRVNEFILGSRNCIDYEQGSIIRFRDFDTSELCDIKAIEKLTNLQYLYLDTIRWPQEKIPKWMKIMAKLGIMNLDKRFSIDLKPIEKLKNLRFLGIYDTSISSFESIRNVISLERLFLNNTNVSDLEPLKGLKNIKKLEIRKCPSISEREIEDLQKAMPDLNITYEK